VRHLRATDDVVETASFYVLGLLAAGERAAFERHLGEGCRTCQREVVTLGAVAAELGLGVPARAPRPEVRERLLARVAGSVTIVRAGDARGEHDPSGLEVRRLHREAVSGLETSLVRMAPGARYPGHPHASRHALYVLTGDVTVEGQRLGAGDYCAAAGGSLHDEAVTEGGCTFVLVTSEGNESAPGPTVVRAGDGDWRPGVVAGVEVRRLHYDRAHGTFTGFVRMAAGTELPRHRHITAEQLYMLSGDAHIAHETLGPGDYHRAAAGTAHDVTRTERGCEFLLISSAVEMLT
jgi:anti-sigma factor ChrR (cupin superfamily)